MYGVNKSYKRLKNIRKKGLAKRFITIIISLFIISFMLGNFSLLTKADEKQEFNIYYSSIKIENNVSIEDIANKYNNISVNTNSEYIEKIKNINSLSSNKLSSGCYLIVECYSIK